MKKRTKRNDTFKSGVNLGNPKEKGKNKKSKEQRPAICTEVDNKKRKKVAKLRLNSGENMG